MHCGKVKTEFNSGLVRRMKMEDYFEIVRQVLIPVFYKEAMLGRSLRVENQEFKKQVFDSCIELANKADNGTLRNGDIRNRIVEISKNANASIGQTQKIINVYLKYYCILTRKSLEIIKELDCPLDSQVMTKHKEPFLKKRSLKGMTEISCYLDWQEHLKSIGKGIRLNPDITTYDKQRIEEYFKKRGV
jgi:hypothetical protein